MKKGHARGPLSRNIFATLLAFFITVTSAHSQSPGSAAAPWKFALFSDGRSDRGNDPGATNGVRWASYNALAAHAASQHVSLVMFPGDLANGGRQFGLLKDQWAAWSNALAPLYTNGIPVYPTRGNHEVAQDYSVTTWTNMFSYLPRNGPPGQEGLTYKVETNNALIIGFDQYIGRSTNFDAKNYKKGVNSGMVSPWVIDQIKSTTKRWVFVFAHEAAYIGMHDDGLVNVPEERDALFDALGEKSGLYLCGHDHMYVRRQAPDSHNNPVLEIVAGDGGAPPYGYTNFWMNSNYDRGVVPTTLFVNSKDVASNTKGYPMYFGYVLVTVYPDRLEGEWWALTNYDTTKLAIEAPPTKPKFEKLDTFTWVHR
jgi:Calcineurin-like phosphoesterase